MLQVRVKDGNTPGETHDEGSCAPALGPRAKHAKEQLDHRGHQFCQQTALYLDRKKKKNPVPKTSSPRQHTHRDFLQAVLPD